MLITVYIVNYNYSKYLGKAIESVLNQTYSNLELLILDDGSTDESKDVIERFNDSRIKVFYNTNQGLIANCNLALSHALGGHIMRLDADDFLVPSALQEMISKFRICSDTNLVYSNYYVVNERDEVLGQRERIPFEENKILDSPAHGACCLIKLETLKKIGGYQTKYRKQDGYYLWFKFLDYGGIESIRKPLFYYRRHDSNMTNNYDEIIAARNMIILNEYKCNSFGSVVLPIRIPFDRDRVLSFVERLVEECSEWSSLIKKLIIVTSDIYFSKLLKERCTSDLVRVILRSLDEEVSMGLLEMLRNTFDLELSSNKFVVTLDSQFEKIDIDLIRAAIYTLHKFEAERVVSVIPESGMLFRRTEKGLSYFYSGTSYHKSEREDLYRFTAGINVFSCDALETASDYDDLITAHVLVESKYL